MLRLNGKRVEIGSFPDGTLLLKLGDFSPEGGVLIDWRYESDQEIFALYSLTRRLQQLNCEIELFMPYIPNARQDRVKRPEDIFTLKYFAEIINTLNFNRVTVLDPHSAVSEALFERLRVIRPDKYIKMAAEKIGSEKLLLFYPDEGAMRRYADTIKLPYVFGVKDRCWETGEILGLEVIDEKGSVAESDILVVDDICSKGETLVCAARALLASGANEIYLFATHCEKTILEGEVLTTRLVKKVYTTDSICAVEHEKIEIFRL